jgi:hypothetical protein
MPSAELRRFRAVARVAFKVSIALVGLNAVFGLLVVAGTWAAGCAVPAASADDGAGSGAGSGTGVGLVFIPALLAAMVGLMTSPRHDRTFEEHNVAPYEFLPRLTLTLAELVFYSTLAGTLAILALMLDVSVTYSLSLLSACPAVRPFG